MDEREVTRRAMLQGGVALAGLAALGVPTAALAAPAAPGEEILPWLDQPAPNPIPDIAEDLLVWEDLDTWITPNNKFFSVRHYDKPTIGEQAWRLEITGLVHRPMTLTLDALKARRRHEVNFTLECSGNHGFNWNFGLVGNARWGGTRLAPLLREAGVMRSGTEVVFWGTDSGPGELRGITFTEQFARSLSLDDALDSDALLCYEMNGQPLPQTHGFPVRLLVPGRYGIANVKWLRRIEVLDRRYEGNFMGRDYVTMRKAQQDGQEIVRFTSVGLANLKSAPARVVRKDGRYRIEGVAWGKPIGRAEVRIDGGPWIAATLGEGGGEEFAWRRWSLPWTTPTSGEHAITSLAIDKDGNIQPAPTDPVIANKLTFWESNGQITRRVRIS